MFALPHGISDLAGHDLLRVSFLFLINRVPRGAWVAQ